MLKPIRPLMALVALFVVLGALPALADEGTGDTPGTEDVEEPDDEGAGINAKFLILFAEGFNVTEEDLTALRDLELGWGDLFKLNLYATLLGTSVEDLLSEATFDEGTGEWEFDWGQIKKQLTEEQLALLDETPRNLGQLVSASKRHHGRDAHQPSHAQANKANKPAHAGKKDA